MRCVRRRGVASAAAGAFRALALHRPHPQDVHAAGAAAGAELLPDLAVKVGGLPAFARWHVSHLVHSAAACSFA
jgi:hypothetical protein